ncbi:uncharacterized protein LOC129588751 [Paramacrobiotus metropolitanus]|uniref:uncharacterized protein LOC129588751 n=1 Tax=Paramacrobiotus metropolitanus TaxID=2943436 RepID=UPI002445D0ED|nr:uncharacterized protein LOC129588751 [Paramacrobiotus metropolitanus]
MTSRNAVTNSKHVPNKNVLVLKPKDLPVPSQSRKTAKEMTDFCKVLSTTIPAGAEGTNVTNVRSGFGYFNCFNYLGINSQLVHLISDYLKGRKQCVIVNGCVSEVEEVTSGVPQGSTVGPCFFICVLNFLPSALIYNSELLLFADDIALYRPIMSTDDEIALQSDLTAVENWARRNKLVFNAAKSFHVSFSKKRAANCNSQYYLNGDAIVKTECVKYLGVILDRNLKFKDNTGNLVTKFRKKTRWINVAFRKADSAARIQLYKSLVFTSFDYCCPFIAPTNKTCRDKLERCLERFVYSLCLGSESFNERLLELKWDCFELRRLKRSLVLVYKLVFNHIPLGERFFLPFEQTAAALSCISGHTRSANRLSAHPFPITAAPTTLCGITLPPSSDLLSSRLVQLWNEMTLDKKDYASLNVFKNALDNVCWSELNCVKRFRSMNK